jgi:hypothetical protein
LTQVSAVHTPGTDGAYPRPDAFPESNRRQRDDALLTGCGIGEVLGFVIGTRRGWGDWRTMGSPSLSRTSSATRSPSGGFFVAASRSERLSAFFVADTLSITVMEIVDNGVMLVVPGRNGSEARGTRSSGGHWPSLAVAWVAAFPVNRWLTARGRGDRRACTPRPRLVTHCYLASIGA